MSKRIKLTQLSPITLNQPEVGSSSGGSDSGGGDVGDILFGSEVVLWGNTTITFDD